MNHQERLSKVVEAIRERAAKGREMFSAPGLMYEDGARDFAQTLLGILEDDDSAEPPRAEKGTT